MPVTSIGPPHLVFIGTGTECIGAAIARVGRLAAAVPGLLAALAAAHASLARAEVSCPDQLSVQQRAEAPQGWSVNYAETSPRLAGVALFDGPPSNRASVKFDQRKQTDRELTLVWKLRDSPRSHYLQCSYERTTATIATALPPGVRECEVVFDRTSSYPGGGSPVKRNVCR
jgi:hypothetical protein